MLEGWGAYCKQDFKVPKDTQFIDLGAGTLCLAAENSLSCVLSTKVQAKSFGSFLSVKEYISKNCCTILKILEAHCFRSKHKKIK